MLGAPLVLFLKDSVFFNKTVKNELLTYSQKQSLVLLLNKSDILNRALERMIQMTDS